MKIDSCSLLSYCELFSCCLLVVTPVCSVVQGLKHDVVPGDNLKKLWELLE